MRKPSIYRKTDKQLIQEIDSMVKILEYDTDDEELKRKLLMIRNHIWVIQNRY